MPPRVVALHQDVWDTAGNAVAWKVVAWGLVLADGGAVTVPSHGPTSATVWQSLDDACRAFDASVCEVRPRPYPQWWRNP